MSLLDLHPLILEAFGAHSALCRLGFAPSEVFVAIINHEECRDPHLFVQLRAQSRMFAIDIGHLDTDVAILDWYERIRIGMGEWNDASQVERDEIYRHSACFRNSVALVAGLARKGITAPVKETKVFN